MTISLPLSFLFPYTTLFRSLRVARARPRARGGPEARGGAPGRGTGPRNIGGLDVEAFGAPVRPRPLGVAPARRAGGAPVQDCPRKLLKRLALVLADADAREERALDVAGVGQRGLGRSGRRPAPGERERHLTGGRRTEERGQRGLPARAERHRPAEAQHRVEDVAGGPGERGRGGEGERPRGRAPAAEEARPVRLV